MLSERLELYPDERVTLYVNCHPCPESGLPAGISPGSPAELLDAVRTVTGRLDAIPVTEAAVRAAKATLLKDLENRYAAPETLLEDVLVRYSEGKDLVSDYKAAVQRVSVTGVKEVLELLSDGGEVEYTIQ